jgi:LETM1 and EF-hand domain-containing protein 1, mitochondrial
MATKHKTINSTRLSSIATKANIQLCARSFLHGSTNNLLLYRSAFSTRFSFYNNFNTSSVVLENASSKVEVTVKTIKEKETQAQQPTLNTSVSVTELNAVKHSDLPTALPVVKKSLGQRIWAELVHYYHGFRLLWIDINVSRKLLWRVLMGKTLTRREHRLLIRTTSDLFRLVPFSVFIIVPFMELLLPLAIKLFPGMLPSTFQTATEKEDKIKQNFKVKLEMAKFLQKTLDEMSVQHAEHRSEEAKEFSDFFQKIRRTDGMEPTADEIIKFSKLFEDEITLDSLNRQQIQALCRVLEVNTIGTTNILLFQLRMKLRSLATDDRLIQKEGIQSLNLTELQSACRARGMRAYGISKERLEIQLQEWIQLSLNEKVPPSLLLLSRALMLPENVPTSDKLKATISALPETVGTQTKAAIGEREGKIDNKTKIEIILEEQRKIKEERAEQNEIDLEKSVKLADETIKVLETSNILSSKLPVPEELSSKDFEVLNDALESLSKEKMKLIVEKEEIKDLKEEIADYKEDVEELNEARLLYTEQ